MAKKHLIELEGNISKMFTGEISKIEIQINKSTKESMVDPEDVQIATGMLRGITTKVQNLLRGLNIAANRPDEFSRGYSSSKTLVISFENTIRQIEQQEPDHPLIKEYVKQLIQARSTVQLYEDIKEVRDRPKAKKRLKKWIKKGWYSPDKPFRPLKDIWEELKILTTFLEENL